MYEVSTRDRVNAVRDDQIYGRHITFDDGREGIISGGSRGPAALDSCWVRSLDGRTMHQYSRHTIAYRIVEDNLVFPID